MRIYFDDYYSPENENDLFIPVPRKEVQDLFPPRKSGEFHRCKKLIDTHYVNCDRAEGKRYFSYRGKDQYTLDFFRKDFIPRRKRIKTMS